MQVIKPPNDFPAITSIFLAGSIEQGAAAMWQDDLIETLKDKNLTILNPRRDHWDPTWEQSIENQEFVDQVTWELDAMGMAQAIVFYFDPNTLSPITLLELGLWANNPDKVMVVCCPDGYWRKGNVEVICDRYDIDLLDTLDELKTFLINGL